MPAIFPMEGACTCGTVRFRMLTEPLVVHCCHCRWCQRETGTAFGLNAMIEADRVELLAGAPEAFGVPTQSGRGQKIVRCPACRIAVWSHYGLAGDGVSFVRVGTLAQPDHLPPDIHIFVASKLPWVAIPDGVPAVPEFYDPKVVWRPESLERRRALAAARRAGSAPA